MFHNILVQVDPARPFDAANRYAVDLAHRFGTKLVACYVIDEQLLGPVGDEAANSLDVALEWVGRDAVEDFARLHPDLDVKKTIAYGSTPTALFQVVLQSGADLVVVGGYHPLAAPRVWGSVVEDIVHHAERPVFIVRKPARLPGPGDTIVVPFDGSERPVLNLVRITELAQRLEASIDLVHIARAKHAARAATVLEKGAWIVKEHGVQATTHVLQASLLKNKGRIILDHAKATEASLVAISRLGRRGMETGRSRTVGWLAAHSGIPVWVVRK